MREGRELYMEGKELELKLDMMKKVYVEFLKEREIRDKQESSHWKQPQTFATQNRFKRVAESFMPQ